MVHLIYAQCPGQCLVHSRPADSAVRKRDPRALRRPTLTRGLSSQENAPPRALGARLSPLLAESRSPLWSEAGSSPSHKHGLVRLKMYFKNVTNY